jgi:subtilase family serine protease
VVDTVTISSLDPGASREVAVLGPACTSTVSSSADPEGVIVESAEDDNDHTVDCQA